MVTADWRTSGPLLEPRKGIWKQLVEYLVVFQAAHHKAEVRTGWKGCWGSRVQHPQRSVLGPFGHNGYFELHQFLQTSLTK